MSGLVATDLEISPDTSIINDITDSVRLSSDLDITYPTFIPSTICPPNSTCDDYYRHQWDLMEHTPILVDAKVNISGNCGSISSGIDAERFRIEILNDDVVVWNYFNSIDGISTGLRVPDEYYNFDLPINYFYNGNTKIRIYFLNDGDCIDGGQCIGLYTSCNKNIYVTGLELSLPGVVDTPVEIPVSYSDGDIDIKVVRTDGTTYQNSGNIAWNNAYLEFDFDKSFWENKDFIFAKTEQNIYMTNSPEYGIVRTD